MTDPTNAERKHRMRDKRRRDGWKRVELWLTPEEQAFLSFLGPSLPSSLGGVLDWSMSRLPRPDKIIANSSDKQVGIREANEP